MDDIAKLGLVIETGQVRTAISELNSLQNQSRNLESQVSRTQSGFSKLNQVLGGLSLTVVAGSMSKLADSATSVENALRQVTTGSQELATSSAQLLAIANETRSSYESTVELYSKLARSTEDLGISQDRLFRVTEIINKSFAASGATAIEASNAIRQLAQGLSSGALRGDEFNSVAEQAPDILRAVARELNVTYGEVRKLAGEGKLTADILIKSLENYGETVDRNFAKSTATMSQFFEVAKNNAIREVQQSKVIREANQAVGQALVTVSQNIGELAEAGKAAGAVLATYLVVNLVKTAQATAENVAASIAATAQKNKETQAAITAAQAEVALLRIKQQHFAQQTLAVQGSVAWVAARQREAAVTAQLAAAETGLAAAQARLAASSGALGAATGFLLGPWGMLVTTLGFAAAAFIATKEASAETSSQFNQDAVIVQQLAEKYANLAKAAPKVFGAKAVEIQTKLAEATQKHSKAVAELESLQARRSSEPGLYPDILKKQQEIERLNAVIADLTLKNQAVNEAFAAGIPKAEGMTNGLKQQKEVVVEVASEYTKLKQSLTDQVVELTVGADAYQRYEALTRLGTTATKEQQQEIDALVLKIQNLTQAKKDSEAVEKTKTRFQQTLKETKSQNNPAQQAADEYMERIRIAEEYGKLDAQKYEESLLLKREAHARFTEEIAEIERRQKGEGMFDRLTTSLAGFKDQVSGTMASVALGFQDGDEAAKQLAQTILTQLVGAMINYGIEQAIAYATGATAATAAEAAKTTAVVTSLGIQTTAANAAQGTVTAGAVASGSAITAAMAPAAAATSVATAGAAPAAATPIALGTIAAIMAALVAGVALFGRAQGGSVSAGRTYKFNEHGPELFTPRTAGKVTPFNQLMREARAGDSGSSKTANVTFDIRANDATSFQQMLNDNRDVIHNIIQRALNEQGREL